MKELEIDFSSQISAKKGKAPLNKPFRLPSGSKKKFGVYVKNDKGNIVKVTFGDPNMSIKRDNPARRKAYRSRHGCDNPGPKYKANYWSCKMWSAKPVSKITGSEEEITLEADIQAKNKGLWYNIQQKKKRMGKNYRPAPEGSKDRPSQEALKKAQAEEYEWDGETEFDQNELLKLDPSLAQAPESPEEELQDYKEDFYEMIVGSINSIYQHSKNIIDKLNDPMVKENLTEPFLQQMAALAEDYMITIHNFVMFNKENESVAQMTGPINDYVSKESKRTDNWSTPINEYTQSNSMFKVGDKIININPYCKHYGSEGIVKEIRDLPEDMGYAVVYQCTNDGANWKKGDMVGKTEIQLKKIKASEDEIEDDYDMEEDDDYKGMMVTEGQKFNDFLKQCIPTKQGDGKSKFKSCLQDYKNKK
jgi:hypothetical protein